jgi:hypothetical protein
MKVSCNSVCSITRGLMERFSHRCQNQQAVGGQSRSRRAKRIRSMRRAISSRCRAMCHTDDAQFHDDHKSTRKNNVSCPSPTKGRHGKPHSLPGKFLIHPWRQAARTLVSCRGGPMRPRRRRGGWDLIMKHRNVMTRYLRRVHNSLALSALEER